MSKQAKIGAFFGAPKTKQEPTSPKPKAKENGAAKTPEKSPKKKEVKEEVVQNGNHSDKKANGKDTPSKNQQKRKNDEEIHSDVEEEAGKKPFKRLRRKATDDAIVTKEVESSAEEVEETPKKKKKTKKEVKEEEDEEQTEKPTNEQEQGVEEHSDDSKTTTEKKEEQPEKKKPSFDFFGQAKKKTEPKANGKENGKVNGKDAKSNGKENGKANGKENGKANGKVKEEPKPNDKAEAAKQKEKPAPTEEETKEKKEKEENVKEEKKEKEDEPMEDANDEIEEEHAESGGEGEKKVVTFQRKQTAAQKKLENGGKKKPLVSNGKYDPIADAGWQAGQPVPYMALAKTFSKIEQTSGRLEIIEHLSNLYRSVIALTPEDLVMIVYLTTNRIAPAYEGIELNLGEALLIKTIADATGRTANSIKEELQRVGDLGLLAQTSKSSQRMMITPTPLTIRKVYKTLQDIASESGHSAMNKKKERMKGLLVACKDCETQWIIRSLQGKLRIGLAEKGVLAALARAITLTPPAVTEETKPKEEEVEEKEKKVKKLTVEERIAKANETLRLCYSQLPNYELLVKHLIKYGIDELPSHCTLTPGIPVGPMLAQPTKGISEVLDRFQDMEFTCEYKYDGERAQIHCLADGSIRVYSRNLEDNTKKYPDIVQTIKNYAKPGTTSFILDCEAVAFDKVKNKILPFQILSTRARKEVKMEDIKVKICLYVFDLLYLNGKPVIDETLKRRREIISEAFTIVDGEFVCATYRDISDVNDIQPFLNEAVQNSCEGLMVKTLTKESTYEPSKRSYNWLKIKKDYLEGLTDTVDIVPIAAWYGKGKRTGLYGAFLLACYDDDNEEYQTVCKIGTGFSDEDLAKHTEELKKFAIDNPRPYYRVSDTLKPDVWLEPAQVWEVLAADLSISPVHSGATGIVDPAKGIALRFPRFLKIREDKNPENATTATQIAEFYRKQQVVSGSSSARPADDDW
eukprot:Phypoly_transcript_01908.p1 GENE.Phypoly_transcript_01908~~Phypoly_transcript_01908.p1  ORF type:complete len:972 (+),score=243.78 Phypoly_transcript_01908:40-2955(+)